jgi:hypothetical protein
MMSDEDAQHESQDRLFRAHRNFRKRQTSEEDGGYGADADSDGPAKKKPRRSRQSLEGDVGYGDDANSDGPTGKQSQKPTNALPPHFTYDSLFDMSTSKPPTMSNLELGQWFTEHLDGKDAHIAHERWKVEQLKQECVGHTDQLHWVYKKITYFQQDLEGVKRRLLYPGFSLEVACTKMKDTFFSKLKTFVAVLDSKDLKIAALEKQLQGQIDEAMPRLEEKGSETTALKAKSEDNVGGKEQLEG